MKNIKYLFVFVLLASFFACNEYDENNRWKYKETIILTDTSIYAQNVLIEDFTGQLCQNCPNAAAVIDTLQMQLNNDSVQRVIAVAIHGGSKARLEPTGLATSQGTAYHTACGVTEWPLGLINRKGVPSKYTEWKAQVTALLSQESEFALEGNASCHNDSLFIKVKAIRNQNVQPSSTLKMGVWVTEDSIVAVQQMPDTHYDANYVHKHVFRTSLTEMSGNAFNVNEMGCFNIEYNCPVKTGWNKEQLHAVVFVTNGAEVLQVYSFKFHFIQSN